MRDDDWRAIGERDDTEFEGGGFRRVAGVSRADPSFRQARKEPGKSGAFSRLAQELTAIRLK